MTTVNAYYSSVYSSSGWDNATKVSSNDSNFMSTNSSPSTAIYNITNTVPTGETVTSITYYVDAKDAGYGGGGGAIQVSLYIGGSWYTKSSRSLSTSETRYSWTWTGSWSKTETDAQRFKIVGTYSGTWIAQVDYFYCVQTYTTPPSAPTNVNTNESPCYDGQSTITWTKASGATKYRIYESTSSGGTYSAIGSELGDVSSGPTDTETVAKTLYYKVKAGNAGGWSALSSTYATVIFRFNYDKAINGISDYTEINGIAAYNITAWNGIS